MSEVDTTRWTLGPEKRAMDLVGITALMPLFVPAGAMIAGAIAAKDRMNPIFTQTRYGLGFEPFTFYKFQTMPTDVDHESPSAGAFDERRTPLGTMLAKYHQDEMPQAINVYNGTMSLVGPRALVWKDVEDTLDLQSPAEQKTWVRSRSIAKPGEFGPFQLLQHTAGYETNQTIEESLLQRAEMDNEYAATANFHRDMGIIIKTAHEAFRTVAGTERGGNDAEHLRGESGARMLAAVARGFGVEVSSFEYEWLRATLLAARVLDDIVDTDGVEDLREQVDALLQGEAVGSMSETEALAFKEVFFTQHCQRRDRLISTYLALPEFARRKRRASSTAELRGVSAEEAELFGEMLYLEPVDGGRKRFNRWLAQFAQTGYLMDLALDAKSDFRVGNINVLPTGRERLTLGAAALRDSLRLLSVAPADSYRHLAKGVVKTLLA